MKMTMEERKAVGDIQPPYARQAQDLYEERVKATEALQDELDGLADEFRREVLNKRMADTTLLADAHTRFTINPATGRHEPVGLRLSTVGELVYETAECVDSAWDKIFAVVVNAANAGDPLAVGVVNTLAMQYARMKAVR